MNDVLQRAKTGSGRVRVRRDLALEVVEAATLGDEPLVNLLQQKLHLRIHGSTSTLKPGEVLVIGELLGIQIGKHTPQIDPIREGNYEIPTLAAAHRLGEGLDQPDQVEGSIDGMLVLAGDRGTQGLVSLIPLVNRELDQIEPGKGN